MSSREDILQNIRRNTQVRYERPDLTELEENALTYPDKVAQFCAIMKQMGGEAVVLGKEDDLNEIIREKPREVSSSQTGSFEYEGSGNGRENPTDNVCHFSS